MKKKVKSKMKEFIYKIDENITKKVKNTLKPKK